MFRIVAVERAEPELHLGLQVVQDDADEEQDEKQRKEQDEPQDLPVLPHGLPPGGGKDGRYLLRMCFTSQASRSSFPRANSRWKAS